MHRTADAHLFSFPHIIVHNPHQIHSNSMPLPRSPWRVCVLVAVGILTANKLKCFSLFTIRRGGLISGCSFCFYFSPSPDGWTLKSGRGQERDARKIHKPNSYLIILYSSFSMSPSQVHLDSNCEIKNTTLLTYSVRLSKLLQSCWTG